MCEDCPIRSDRVQSAEFLEGLAEDFALMAQDKKHPTIDAFLAKNWGNAFANAAKELRAAEEKIANMHAALGIDYSDVVYREQTKEEPDRD